MHSSVETSPSAHKWLAMTGIGLGVFMATLDSSIVNITLPTLMDYFHTNFATIQWVVLSYVLVLTALMLSIARLGDMRGKKRIYQFGLVLFTLGSLLCGASPSVGWLIAFRALQGLGATMMQALGTAIITEVFPASERGRALGIIGSIVAIGIAIGPPTGGLLIGLIGWRAIFLVNVPIGLFTAWVVNRYVPAIAPHNANQRFDLPGALIMLVTLAAYAFGMTMGEELGFGSAPIVALLSAAALGLGVFVWVELRQPEPMVNLSLFRNTLFSLNLVMGLLVFIALSGFFILPFFLENVQGYTTQQVGLLLMVQPVVSGLVAPLSGLLSDRLGSRLLSLIGLVVVALGCLFLSTLQAGMSAFAFGLRMAVLGLGLAIFQAPNNSAIMGSVPRHKLGIASGLLSLSRTLGQTSGLPLMGAIFTARVLASSGQGHGSAVTNAPAAALVSGVSGTYHTAAWVILGSALLAALALWLDARKKVERVAPADRGA